MSMASNSNQISKKLINKVLDCERECNEGLVAVNTGLNLVDGHNVVVRTDARDVAANGKVILISGGGSGHEPGHAGYVGKGGLTACAFGSVFTSPPPGCILAAVNAACQQQKGCQVLMIVTNYTGDRLNFGIACERARVKGHMTEMVVVGEDCALDSVDHSAGRRGLAGTMMIHKIAGAMSEQGKSLEDIVSYLNLVKERMGTIGLSLSPCSVPGSGPSFSLQSDEMELGLGVHGEAGVRRMKIQTAREAVKTMMDHMRNPNTSTHIDVKQGDRVALMVNNLGGTSVLEMNIVAKEAISYLEDIEVSVDRAYCGTFMTSLEMAGISITLLHIDDLLLEYLDFPCEIPAWHAPCLVTGQKLRKTPVLVTLETESHSLSDAGCEKLSKESSDRVYKALRNACEQLVAMEKELNKLDTQSGDGDCGSTLALGAKAILKKLGVSTNPGLPVDCPHTLALSLGQITENVMGGSSGALYSLFFTSAAQELRKADPKSLYAALSSGLESIIKYGGAKPGYRTMVDPIYEACESLKSQDLNTLSTESLFRISSEAAKLASEKTVSMIAQAGRASYVNKSLLTKPDPGAVAILKKNPAKYATWFAHHKENGCTINYDGTSGMMESEAAVKIWQISLALLNFRGVSPNILELHFEIKSRIYLKKKNYYWGKKTCQSLHRKNQNSQQILWGAVRSNRTAEEMKKAILASLYHNYSI
ncbi:bifunctional ATP-dependent dihydroxyacetone kinase/FAD-AMP lyase (cyclizing) [Biomphalaria pfeifferi]|uniref:Triokinase/FMN cyclase n=1 Tax=Biomphalaria pfeifferi TaxID=112525 RepID=A0AAD8AQH8_BIOPF|nr:bifunctional ATP-dependent dihydroxyacetone kinase/FAD-AMP lyase (cyclizing) [Biomphalaria pfeifferi]